MKKVKGKTAIEHDAARPTKPAAPSGRARKVEPHVQVFPERGPHKTDVMPKLPAERGGNVKPPAVLDEKKPRRSTGGVVDYGDQIPKKVDNAGVTDQGDRRLEYIRMRVRVIDGRLAVVDSHLVEGPLAQAGGFTGSNAYEVTLGDRLLHAGELPDLGIQRSFVNPDKRAPKEQKGHHVTERTSYEFTARMPAAEVNRDTVGRIAIRLYRLKEEARADHLKATPLHSQFAREVRPVAELVGLPESVLPEAIERRGGRAAKA